MSDGMTEAAGVEVSLPAKGATTDDKIAAFMQKRGFGEKTVPDDVDLRAQESVEPDTDEDSQTKEVPKPVEDPKEDPKPEEKKEAAQTKHWAQRAKAELAEAQTTVKHFQDRDARWQDAASKVAAEVYSLREQVEFYKQAAETHGFVADPRDEELRLLRTQLSSTEQQKQIQANVAAQRAEAQRVQAIRVEANTHLEQIRDTAKKYPELGDAGTMKKVLDQWVRLSGDESFSDFAEEAIDRMRWKQERSKIDRTRRQIQGNANAPRAIRAGGSSQAHQKFPATDDGINAWMRSRGYM